MSQVVRIPSDTYKRLESYAVGFDTPASVIERLLDFYETHNRRLDKPMDLDISTKGQGTSFMQSSLSSNLPRQVACAHGRFRYDLRDDTFTILSPQGESKTFRVPPSNDKEGIRKLTHQAEEFVKKQGGKIGQQKAARKKLTEFGLTINK